MFGRRAGVHEGLSDDGQTSVGDAALVDVEHKLRILYDVHPEPERKAADTQRTSVTVKLFPACCHDEVWMSLSPVALPGVSDIRVADLPFVSLLVQEVEHVFDSQWESRASVGGAKHRLKQVVHKLLQRPLVEGRPKHVIRTLSSFLQMPPSFSPTLWSGL